MKLRSSAFAFTAGRNSTEKITAGYSFGLGYRYDNFVIDLLTEGDFASLSSWRVSLSYCL
jgi:hypothetical protein